MSDLKPITIKGEVFFAKDTYVLNKHFDEDNDRYMLTIGNLSEAAQDALQKLGIKVKDKTLPGKHIVSKSKFPFKFLDAEKNEIPNERIGNGTVVTLQVTPRLHKLSKMHGAAANVRNIKVLELKEYNPERATEEDDVVL